LIAQVSSGHIAPARARRAWLVGWPVAAVVVFLGAPVVRRITLRLVALIEGTR
jgi:hypothetical protein